MWNNWRSLCLYLTPSGEIMLKDKQFQLLVTGLTWCDCVLWSEKGIHINRIEMDHILIHKLITNYNSLGSCNLSRKKLKCTYQAKVPLPGILRWNVNVFNEKFTKYKSEQKTNIVPLNLLCMHMPCTYLVV